MTECFNVTIEPFPRVVDFKNSVYKGSNKFNFVIGWYKTPKINKETRECGFVVNRCSKHVILTIFFIFCENFCSICQILMLVAQNMQFYI